MIKRVLLALGGSAYCETAIRHAVDLAARHGASVTALTVIDTERLSRVGPVPLGGGAAADELREHRISESREYADRLVEMARTQCAAAQVDCRVQQEEADPFAIITGMARYYDLMVFGIRSTFEYGVQGETHYEPCDLFVPLIRAGVRPVLAVPETYQPIHRIVIAYGGSMESAKTMRMFAQLNLWPDAELHLLSVAESTDGMSSELQEAADYLAAHGLAPELHSVVGSPRKLILPTAESIGAQLLVMGNSARRLITSKIFGESIDTVLRQSEIGLFLSQ